MQVKNIPAETIPDVDELWRLCGDLCGMLPTICGQTESKMAKTWSTHRVA